MHPTRLFWKLFVFFTCLSLLMVLAIGFVITEQLERQIIREVKARLLSSATAIKIISLDYLSTGRKGELQKLSQQIGKDIDLRVTLVDLDGTVFADSSIYSTKELLKMENHKERKELVHARTERQAFTLRVSSTLNQSMLYCAVRADQNNKPVILVRTSIAMSRISNNIDNMKRNIWLVAVVSVSCTAATFYILIQRILQPINGMTKASIAITNGDYYQRIDESRNDELGVLAQSFNQMSRELSQRLTQLQETSQRLGTVLRGMVEAVIAVDERGRIFLANDAAGKLLDFTPEEVEGQLLLESIRNHVLQDSLNAILESPHLHKLEIEFGENPHKVLNVNLAPLPGSPCPGIVIVMHDISELRRLEQLRQEFIANVSHELKTPLSSIKAYTETLLNGALEDAENRSNFVQRIEEQSERLHQLIHDMLTLAQVESGQQAFHITSIPLTRAINNCISQYQNTAEAKSIQLITSPPEQPIHVNADQEGLRQILGNLIDNAIKYTPSKGQVEISWQAENSMAIIEVKDTGIGIDESHHDRLFERFYRIDKARSREIGGTGLGLAIVKHLVQSFGGKISMNSKPQKGSCFTIILPLSLNNLSEPTES